jgi:putative transcriptional regulator
MRIERRALAAFCLVAAVVGLGAVGPGPTETPPAAPDDKTASAPPPGNLLIANESIQDPRFSHTVILILRHDKDGAFGIVINRPLGDKPIAALLAGAGDDDSGIEGTIAVFNGGPVDQRRGFVVHTTDYHRAETMEVDGKVAMTATKEALRDIGLHRGPKKCFFAFGYAGWGPDQLEGEIARHDWVFIPEDPTLVFDDDRDGVWQHAITRRGQDL